MVHSVYVPDTSCSSLHMYSGDMYPGVNAALDSFLVTEEFLIVKKMNVKGKGA